MMRFSAKPLLVFSLLGALLAAGCAASRHSLGPGQDVGSNPVVEEGPTTDGAVGSDEDLDEAFEEELAALEEELEEELVVWDPIEPINRGFFWINDKLYFYLFKPIVRVYRIVPEPARVSVSNFIYNLGMPLRFLNKSFQLKLDEAGYELTRFFVNTTAGLGGLFDPARDWERLRKKEADFGQTLGHYGAGPGFYLVLPVLGPSNLRDGVGLAADWLTNPVRFLLDDTVRLGIAVTDRGTYLSLDKDTYESIVEESLDPYLFIRNAYLQKRRAEIAR